MRPLLTSASPGFKIAYLLIFLIIGVFVAGVFSKLIFFFPLLDSNNEIVTLYVYTISQSIFAIALPAYLIVAFTNAKPNFYLKIRSADRNIHDRGINILFTILVFFLSYVFASFLATMNKGMTLPESMSGIEDAMRSMEDAALETTNLLLSGESIGSLILSIVVIAGLAAVSEELFFRGAMQQFIQEKLKNEHQAVWLTALIFSIIHFQFYGFLPRLFLGLILGYLFFYTKNLWMPIVLHFLNNATVIVVNFFWRDTMWYNKIEEITITSSYIIIALISLILTVLLFITYNKRATKI